MAKARTTQAKEMEEATQNSVDKIRDILFGGQMQDYDRRFSRLEEKLTQESRRLAEDLENRISSVDKYMRGEVERLGQQIKQERKERLETLQATETAVQQLGQRLTDRIEQLDESSRNELSQSRQEFHDEVAILQTRLREQQDQLVAAMEEETGRLHRDKVSQDALSGLFSEMGMRLSGEFSLPDEQ